MRKHDWPEILVEKIKEWHGIPFVWGKTDCAMFVIDVINAITDRELFNRSVGMYDTDRGALRAISKLGDSLSALVGERFGDSIRPTMAQRGDILLHENNLGICVGPHGMFRTPEGLVPISIMECEQAWRVD